MTKIAYLAPLLLFAAGCVGFITSIKPTDTVGGIPASGSLLIVNRDHEIPEGFNHSGTTIPKGVYFPDAAFTDGYVNYVSSKKLQVHFPWFMLGGTNDCYAGLTVSMEDPYVNYKFFVYGCEDRVTVDKIAQTIDFDIVAARKFESTGTLDNGKETAFGR